MAKIKNKGMMYLVETPVENYCGVGAGGVQFAYGKAKVRESWVLDWYREHGYTVTELEEVVDDEPVIDPMAAGE